MPASKCFFHPDYTVGSGIAPDQRNNALVDSTTGGELHSALKQTILFIYYKPQGLFCQMIHETFR